MSSGTRFDTLSEAWSSTTGEIPEDLGFQQIEQNLHQSITDDIQMQGGNIWREFDHHAKTLEDDLQKFHDAVWGLGSSLDLAHSARKMRECVAITSWLFQENARNLFPLIVKYSDPPSISGDDSYIEEKTSRPSWPPVVPSNFTRMVSRPETGPIHDQLMLLANSVENLRRALEQFPEFENFGMRPLICLEGDLKYWSSCLAHYDGQYNMREVRMFVHNLSNELGRRFGEICRCVSRYTSYVPNVRSSQQRAMSNFRTLATIATFFSAVTATTIQYSVNTPESSPLPRAALALWFSSLIFSIASALNSSLALMWRTATYSTPEMRIPLWLWVWIWRCPSVFLLISVGTFLAGLGCFAISTQPHVTWIIVFVCEGVSSFSVASLLFLLAADKWSSYRHDKQQQPKSSALIDILQGKPGSVLPTHIDHTASLSIGYISRGMGAMSSLGSQFKRYTGRQTAPKNPTSTTRLQRTESESSRSITGPSVQLWQRAIKNARNVLRFTQTDNSGLPKSDFTEDTKPQDITTDICPSDFAQFESRIKSISQQKIIRLNRRVSASTGMRGLEFHPEGHLLAFCDPDSSMQYELESDRSVDLRHTFGEARQVMWSNSGKFILTRTNRAIHVWASQPGHLQRDIQELIIMRFSGFIASVPNVEGCTPDRFLSVEGRGMNRMTLIDTRGERHWTHEFDNMSIRHVDVIHGPYILIAVDVFQGQQGLRPIKASPVRRLILFNLEHRRAEHEVPLWDEIQHVTVSRNGKMIVVIYKDPPPQLWLLQHTVDGLRLRLDRQFSARKYTSTSKSDIMRPTHFTGKAHFVQNDDLIICTSTDGRIHFYRRDRSDPIHIFEDLTTEKDKLTQLACNPASKDLMFATQSQDGTIRIWNSQDMPTKASGERIAASPVAGTNKDPIMRHTFTESPQIARLPELTNEDDAA
ncbi:hypothetical protein K439DRAFT_1636947 [Ramaria rubella]|nr:hypothetical protein K439DRAFT_1636947 [Ramaria rubella]